MALDGAKLPQALGGDREAADQGEDGGRDGDARRRRQQLLLHAAEEGADVVAAALGVDLAEDACACVVCVVCCVLFVCIVSVV